MCPVLVFDLSIEFIKTFRQLETEYINNRQRIQHDCQRNISIDTHG
jgi:hypothetical protein